MSYTIEIDEDQRKLITAALGEALMKSEAGDDEFTRDEMLLLVDMFEDLPEIEAAEPGMIHEFCL